jgi:hypothetical protein
VLCPSSSSLIRTTKTDSQKINSIAGDAEPGQRGAGSSIENNFVGEIPSGRGIWIGGSEGVIIKRNRIGRTSNGGITLFEDTKSYPVPPAHDIVIRNNIVCGSLGPMASGSGTEIAWHTAACAGVEPRTRHDHRDREAFARAPGGVIRLLLGLRYLFGTGCLFFLLICSFRL